MPFVRFIAFVILFTTAAPAWAQSQFEFNFDTRFEVEGNSVEEIAKAIEPYLGTYYSARTIESWEPIMDLWKMAIEGSGDNRALVIDRWVEIGVTRRHAKIYLGTLVKGYEPVYNELTEHLYITTNQADYNSLGKLSGDGRSLIIGRIGDHVSFRQFERQGRITDLKSIGVELTKMDLYKNPELVEVILRSGEFLQKNGITPQQFISGGVFMTSICKDLFTRAPQDAASVGGFL